MIIWFQNSRLFAKQTFSVLFLPWITHKWFVKTMISVFTWIFLFISSLLCVCFLPPNVTLIPSFISSLHSEASSYTVLFLNVLHLQTDTTLHAVSVSFVHASSSAPGAEGHQRTTAQEWNHRADESPRRFCRRPGHGLIGRGHAPNHTHHPAHPSPVQEERT